MRIAIVNDLKLAIESLSRTIAMIPGASVAWVAEDGAQAVAKCAADVPDIILMDMIMPVMDGVEATRRIMRSTPCPILVVTATVEGNAGKVFEALGAGAFDAVATPGLSQGGGVTNAEPLIRKVQSIWMLRRAAGGGSAKPAGADNLGVEGGPGRSQRVELPPIIAIGCSTGGPQALATVLQALPAARDWAIILVQHIDEQFASGLASWLSRTTGRPVEPASPDAAPQPGRVILASTNDHMVLTSSGKLRYTPEPRETPFRPSVDVFFESLVGSGVKPGVAALLTGMGRDGAAGLRSLRRAGWITLAQDQESSVVWGMPGAAVELGAAVEVLPIRSMGAAIARHMLVQTAARRGGTA